MFLFPSQGSRIQLSSVFSFNHPRSLVPDPGQSSTRLTSLSWFFVSGEHEFSPVEAPLQTIFLKFLFRTSPDNSPHLAAVLTPVCWCPASVAPFLSSCLSTAIVPPSPRGPLVFWERRPRDSAQGFAPRQEVAALVRSRIPLRRQEGAQRVQPESPAKTGLGMLPSPGPS